MAYTVHQAKTHFSRLLKEVEAGKEVVVMRGKKPVAKLVAISEAKQAAQSRALAGAYRGRVSWTDEAFAPLSNEQLHEFGFDDLLEGELVPPPER